MQINVKNEDLKIFTNALEIGIEELDRIGLIFKTGQLKEILKNLKENNWYAISVPVEKLKLNIVL